MGPRASKLKASKRAGKSSKADVSGKGHAAAEQQFKLEDYYHDWGKLSVTEQQNISGLFPEKFLRELQQSFRTSTSAFSGGKAKITPIPDDLVTPFDLPEDHLIADALKDSDAPKHAELIQGLKFIAEGKVAVLCLAGGQGTRLGSDYPKGMFNIGLPSGKSLFQLHAERLFKVQELAAEHSSTPESERKLVNWIILTSPATHTDTVDYFRKKNYLGLKKEQIHFVQQKELPAFTDSGKVILYDREQAAMAPNGNGGLYDALVESGLLDKLEGEGVKYIDTYCVDNALARLADPLFVGHVSKAGGDVGSKVVAKDYASEKVGVFALQGHAPHVVEYSELDAELAAAFKPGTQQLYYNWANISSYLFAPSFIRKAYDNLKREGKYHIARKLIKSFDGPVQGIKLESFIFDPLPLADKLVLMEVKRRAHFAPVKNADMSAIDDTPRAARKLVLDLHKRWLGLDPFENKSAVEISPKISYFGEGLDETTKQKLLAKA